MIINVTINEDDLIGFSEATIFFTPPYKDAGTISFDVWGVDLDKEWASALTGTKFTEDVYVAGMSKLYFEGVKGGKIKVCLYDPQSPNNFFKDSQGRHVEIVRKWGIEFEEKESFRLLDGCVIDWPHGYASTYIVADVVRIELNTDHFVTVRDHIFNLDKYCYRPNKSTRT